MEFQDLHKTWERLGATNPRWAILSEPSRKIAGGDSESFWRSGVYMIGWIASHLSGVGAAPRLGRALDFGCGQGRLTQALAEHFDEVVGVDIAESMIVAARENNRHGDRVEYVHNKRQDLSVLPDASFDFVLTLLVLQHMLPAYALSYVGEFMRVLRPGGIAFFQIPLEPLAPRPQAGGVTTAGEPVGRRSDLRVSYSIAPSLVTARTGIWLWVRVHVRNDSAETLRAGSGGGELGLRFHRPDGSAVAPAVWTALPHDLRAGESTDVLATIQVPETPGPYCLHALVGAARTWCAQPGNLGAAIVIRADPSPTTSDAPRPRPTFTEPDERKPHESNIEVHGTPLRELEDIVAKGGGEIVDVSTDSWAGYEWLSAHFTVRKH